MQVAFDALPLGVAGLQDTRARGAQLAFEGAILHREERRGRRCPHQLGILRQRLVDHHRRHRLVVAVDRHPHCSRRGRRSQQLIALGFGEASRRRIAVAQAERGFVQDGGDLVAPLLG